MNRKYRVWWLLGAAVVILGASAAIYWDALVMVIAPQIPLRKALDAALTSLEQCYQESPVPILLRGYDPDGRNTAQVELGEKGAVLGRLDVQVDLEENQIFFRGTLPEAAKLGSLSVYLDPDHIALTSDTFLQGGYYGITYDTFRQDLQTIPLVSFLVSDSLISQWEDSLMGLQKKMDWDISLPDLPEISIDDLRPATLALWALRGRASVQNLDLEGKTLPCWKVAYAVEGETARFLWEQMAQTPMPEGARVQFSFYLHDKALVGLELDAQAGAQQLQAAMGLHDLTVNFSKNGAAKSLALHTQQERVTLRVDGTAYSYQWNPETGDFTLQLPGKDPLPMNLRPTPDGFQVQSAHLWRQLHKDSIHDYFCTATVTKGASFTAPEYKNLDQWSLDDLLIFLNGVWTLIQPKIG